MKLQNEKKYRLYCTVKYKTLIPIKDWRPSHMPTVYFGTGCTVQLVSFSFEINGQIGFNLDKYQF